MPSTPNSAEASTGKGYLLGLCMLFVVVIIWVFASFLVQYIFHDLDFNAPFFLTYTANSLFILYLPITFGYDKTKDLLCGQKAGYERMDSAITTASSSPTMVSNNMRRIQTLQTSPVKITRSGTGEEGQGAQQQGENNAEDQPSVLVFTPSSHAVQSLNANEVEVAHTVGGTDTGGLGPVMMTNRATMKAALIVCPVWFLANLAYNSSLNYTSVTSNTILSVTSGLFTYMLGVLTKTEDFTIFKLVPTLVTSMEERFPSGFVVV